MDAQTQPEGRCDLLQGFSGNSKQEQLLKYLQLHEQQHRVCPQTSRCKQLRLEAAYEWLDTIQKTRASRSTCAWTLDYLAPSKDRAQPESRALTSKIDNAVRSLQVSGCLCAEGALLYGILLEYQICLDEWTTHTRGDVSCPRAKWINSYFELWIKSDNHYEKAVNLKQATTQWRPQMDLRRRDYLRCNRSLSLSSSAQMAAPPSNQPLGTKTAGQAVTDFRPPNMPHHTHTSEAPSDEQGINQSRKRQKLGPLDEKHLQGCGSMLDLDCPAPSGGRQDDKSEPKPSISEAKGDAQNLQQVDLMSASLGHRGINRNISIGGSAELASFSAGSDMPQRPQLHSLNQEELSALLSSSTWFSDAYPERLMFSGKHYPERLTQGDQPLVSKENVSRYAPSCSGLDILAEVADSEDKRLNLQEPEAKEPEARKSLRHSLDAWTNAAPCSTTPKGTLGAPHLSRAALSLGSGTGDFSYRKKKQLNGGIIEEPFPGSFGHKVPNQLCAEHLYKLVSGRLKRQSQTRHGKEVVWVCTPPAEKPPNASYARCDSKKREEFLVKIRPLPPDDFNETMLKKYAEEMNSWLSLPSSQIQEVCVSTSGQVRFKVKGIGIVEQDDEQLTFRKDRWFPILRYSQKN